MNPKRMEMERNLPELSPNLCKYLWQNLREAGVNISDQDLGLIGKLISSYVKQTPEGKQTMLKLMNIELRPATVLYRYYKAGFKGDESQRIKSTDLQKFEGYIYQSKLSVDRSRIEVDDREDSTICDACGGKFPADYCTKSVEVMKSNGATRVELWCNNCRGHSEQPRLRDTSDRRTCLNCEKLVCESHPKHEMVAHQQRSSVVALLPPTNTNIPHNVPLPAGWSY